MPPNTDAFERYARLHPLRAILLPLHWIITCRSAATSMSSSRAVGIESVVQLVHCRTASASSSGNRWTLRIQWTHHRRRRHPHTDSRDASVIEWNWSPESFVVVIAVGTNNGVVRVASIALLSLEMALLIEAFVPRNGTETVLVDSMSSH